MKANTDIQKAALGVGVVFLLVGVLGFVPGITTQYEELKAAGTESTAKLLGVFQISILHNAVHLLFGVLGLIAAKTAGASRQFLTIGGVIYLVLFLYGLLFGGNADANFVPLNDADDVLHLVLGLGMLALGLLLGRAQTGTTSNQ